MVDVLSRSQRRLNMSRIRGRDTKPEMLIRRALHARGLRFRLHQRKLPGTPDLVFPAHRAVILVHGCFWHDHRCVLCKAPATRPGFWAEKLAGNAARDVKAMSALRGLGWRVLIVWECALRGPSRMNAEALLDQCECFIRADRTTLKEISGASISALRGKAVFPAAEYHPRGSWECGPVSEEVRDSPCCSRCLPLVTCFPESAT